MNVLVLFLFPDRTHVLDICENRLTEAILTNIQSMLLEVLMLYSCMISH